MSFKQSDLDKIDNVISSGVTQVTDRDGKSVRYRPLDEVMRAREAMAKSLLSPKPRRRSPTFSKGL